MTKEAQAEQAHEILATVCTRLQIESARAFLESCPFTTTALAALAQAVRELMNEGSTGIEDSAQAMCIERATRELALIEALEV